jgi:hypothetical protein
MRSTLGAEEFVVVRLGLWGILREIQIGSCRLRRGVCVFIRTGTGPSQDVHDHFD